MPTQRVTENSKKKAKNFKKLKNPVMASFQAKIGWKRLTKRENKNYRFVRSYPTGNRKFEKNSKKILKIQKYHYGIVSCQNKVEKAEKERK